MSSSPKKHIDVVVRYFYPVAAGIETNILETYTVLTELGWDITIHTSADVYEKKNVLPEQEEIRRLHVRRYQWNFWGCWPSINWNTSDAVCLHNFDVFPQVLILMYVIARKVLRLKSPKLFLTPHGGFNPEWSIFSPLAAYIKRTYHYTLGALLINAAVDGVRAVSSWEEKEMSRHGIASSLIRVIPNGMETEAFSDIDTLASAEVKKLVSDNTPYTITVSRVHEIKNYETTLRALAMLPSGNHIIVGPIASAEYKKLLDDMIVALGLSGRVVFAGVIRGIDKYYLIKNALAMVHMAKWESFCNVVHEALSQGTPCIVANNTALSYLIHHEENGFLVDTYNSKELAERIAWVAKHGQDSENIEMNERNKRDYRVTWGDVAANMHEFYSMKKSV